IGLLSCSGAPKSATSLPMVSAISSVPGLGWLRPVTPLSQATTETTEPSPAFLQGQVQQQIPMFNQWLYQLQDGSGSIWVVTTTEPPAVGETVLIRAQIHYEQVLLEGQDIGEHYAEELERLEAPEESPTEETPPEEAPTEAPTSPPPLVTPEASTAE
ncbi:MAG TPA: hypothetical protein V6D06_18090, partial [Trichocoleus sp.]